jgi:hypothetical protein
LAYRFNVQEKLNLGFDIPINKESLCLHFLLVIPPPSSWG